jgi:hypothetical protein
MHFVVEREVAEDPLGVCDVKYPRDKLLGPIFAVEVADGHCEMEGLDCIEVSQNVSLCEIPPSDKILTGCKGLELRGHESHRREWPITSH